MMKRVSSLAAVALLVLALPASAQFYVGGGWTSPTGNYSDVANSGWMGAAGYLFGLGDGPIALGVEGFYGSNSAVECLEVCIQPVPFSGVDKINMYGFMGVADVSFGDADGLSPYLFGGGGLLVGDQGDDPAGSQSNFGYEGGLGLSFPIGSIRGWIEGRYMGSSGVKLFGILGGIAVG